MFDFEFPKFPKFSVLPRLELPNLKPQPQSAVFRDFPPPSYDWEGAAQYLRPDVHTLFYQGTTGSGKSNAAQYMAEQFMAGSHGGAVVDPKSDLGRSIFMKALYWAVRYPDFWKNRPIILLDPMRDNFGLNPLTPLPGEKLNQKAQQVFDSVVSLVGQSAQQSFSLDAILPPVLTVMAGLDDMNVADAAWFLSPLTSDATRRMLAEKAGVGEDRSIRELLQPGESKSAQDQRRMMFDATSRRVDMMVQKLGSTLRYSPQNLTASHLVDVMGRRGLIIIPTSHSKVKEAGGAFGRLFLSMLYSVGASRWEDHPFFCMVDEAAEYLSQEASLSMYLAQARSQGVFFTLLFQSMIGQFQEKGMEASIKVVKDNTDVKIIMRGSADDPEEIARMIKDLTGKEVKEYRRKEVWDYEGVEEVERVIGVERSTEKKEEPITHYYYEGKDVGYKPYTHGVNEVWEDKEKPVWGKVREKVNPFKKVEVDPEYYSMAEEAELCAQEVRKLEVGEAFICRLGKGGEKVRFPFMDNFGLGRYDDFAGYYERIKKPKSAKLLEDYEKTKWECYNRGAETPSLAEYELALGHGPAPIRAEVEAQGEDLEDFDFEE